MPVLCPSEQVNLAEQTVAEGPILQPPAISKANSLTHDNERHEVPVRHASHEAPLLHGRIGDSTRKRFSLTPQDTMSSRWRTTIGNFGIKTRASEGVVQGDAKDNLFRLGGASPPTKIRGEEKGGI